MPKFSCNAAKTKCRCPLKEPAHVAVRHSAEDPDPDPCCRLRRESGHPTSDEDGCWHLSPAGRMSGDKCRQVLVGIVIANA